MRGAIADSDTALAVDALARSRRTFRTRQVDDPPHFIRTFGTVVEAGVGLDQVSERVAVEFAHPEPPPGCARDKVAFFSPAEGSAACYQLSDHRTQARIASCGNASAAVAVLSADARDQRDVSMQIELPGSHAVHATASVTRAREGRGRSVHQTWSRLPFSVDETTHLDGRTYAVCVGALNNYLVVSTKPGEEPADVPTREAVRLWREFGFSRDPLLARMAVVQSVAGADPRVKFFTCGDREHPSAPLTGLTVLALVSERLGWPFSGAPARVYTPAGPMRLPKIRAFADGTATVAFPEVVVDLDEPADLADGV